LDRRRGPETELLRPGDPTPITLSVCLALTESISEQAAVI